jgi:hypothetical protein
VESGGFQERERRWVFLGGRMFFLGRGVVPCGSEGMNFGRMIPEVIR